MRRLYLDVSIVEFSQQTLHQHLKFSIALMFSYLAFLKLNCVLHLFRDESGKVLSTDCGRVPHQLGDLVERFTLLGKVAAKSMSEMLTRPLEPMFHIELLQIQ